MIRLLHISPNHRDFQTQRCVEHLTHDLADDIAVTHRTIGPGGDYQNVPAAVFKFRREEKRQWDVIHAWGLPALSAVVLARRGGLIFSPIDLPQKLSARWFRTLRERAQMKIVLSTQARQNYFVALGASPGQCQVIAPGVDFHRLRQPRDGGLRCELGFEPEDFVVLAPGESRRSVAHNDAIWAVGILNALDERFRVLIWGRGPETDACVRFARKLQAPNLLVHAESQLKRRVRFEELTSVADAALVTARGDAPPLPIAICMAAGLPIVAPPIGEMRELLENRRTALFASRNTPRYLAQGIYDLRQDPALMQTLAANAQAEARQDLSLASFLEQWQTLYRAVAEGKTAPAPANV